MSSEDEEMMYYAGLLLELPQLVYMSEFKEARKQGNWISKKKRSARKIRRAFVDFNCCKSLMARFSSSSSSSSKRCCRPRNKSEKKGVGDVVGKKRKPKKPNPNRGPGSAMDIKKPKPTPTMLMKVRFELSSPSSSSNGHTEKDSSSSSSGVSNELLSVGGADGIMAGKKRKKNPSADTIMELNSQPPKKQKSSLKVTFKFSGRDGNNNIVGHKDSSSVSSGSGLSNGELPSAAAASNAINSSDKAAQPEPSSSLVLVDNNNAAEKKDSNNDDKLMKKTLIPDLNIPITTEEPLPEPTTSLVLVPAAAPVLHEPQAASPPTLIQNNINNKNGCYYYAWGGPVPLILHNMNLHSCDASNARAAAAAKEKRMMRMMKRKQRKMACCQ